MTGNAEGSGRRRHLTRLYRRPAGLAVHIASAALALAARSGGPSTSRVASSGTGSGQGRGSGTGDGSGPARRPAGVITAALAALAAGMACSLASAPRVLPAGANGAVLAAGSHSAGARTGGDGQSRSAGVEIDPGYFSPGACVAFPPTRGNRHLTVFLEAGHGGPDPGAVGTTRTGQVIYEADQTLPVVLDTTAILRRAGFRVVVSRTGPTSVLRLGPGDMSGAC